MTKKAKTRKKSTKPKKAERIVTLEALREMSDDDELPPESEWNDQTKALASAIQSGQFDALVKQHDAGEDEDESSIEEVELGDVDEADGTAVDMNPRNKEGESDDDGDDENETEDFSEEDQQDDREQSQTKKTPSGGGDRSAQSDASEEEKEKHEPTLAENNVYQSKALQNITERFVQKSWPETFVVIPAKPLPFGDEVDIHDDLKREVSFYDHGLLAVAEAREKCRKFNIPFNRPDDFLAEMVKTDDHMAKIKDRLIFESKKMDAVAQRKSNKEQKLRAKESQSQKQAEKAKRKKDHFWAVENWAKTAEDNRNGRVNDQEDMDAYFRSKASTGPNKKRQYADKKWGHGGKRGRFKQNDAKDINSLKGFDRRGNFDGVGRKKESKNGAGANRRGKRARDASRSR